MNKLKNLGKKAVAGSSVALASLGAFAADNSAEITAAGADGVTNTTAAVGAVLLITAVVTGFGIVISILRK